MSNEELAILAKAGDQQATAQLWKQNQGVLSMMEWRLFSSYRGRADAAGVTWDDVQQIGYIAILSAAKGFDPDAGMKFTSYLTYHVRREFYQLVGLCTERSRKEPLCRASSLDEPLDKEDADGSTRAETVPDQTAAVQFENAEERIYINQLHEALEGCMSAIDDDKAETIRKHFFDGMTLQAIAAEMTVSAERVRQLEEKGLRQLRHPSILRRLQQYHGEIVTRAYCFTSFGAWKNGGSSPERWAEWIEEKETRETEQLRQEVQQWAESLLNEKQ